ncbi:hypothetical protein BBK36DRAFT_1119395 [Trichoderma citrinoviride]|uniref:Uncharacterized protein n=1 Tax=Trichoderma citrinoviride TaxID=58853 RepID=A0A2T4BAQ7_9HYPO|nr:hypothetical protein BBK36DRAFT_1119395 [Trichoderma citrinoviride]PTB66414.1 hypothetical protein BBK36DRAFT_1119395 [Trichoderma citrinoviride]
MSGSGGFYKYRCKNFYSHNCPNWVWVNNSPCATCIVNAEERLVPSTMVSHELVSPHIRESILQQTITNPVALNESGESWIPHVQGDGFDEDGQRPQDFSTTSLVLPGSYRTIAGGQ